MRFSRQNYADRFICPFHYVCVALAIMVNAILIEFYNCIGGINK